MPSDHKIMLITGASRGIGRFLVDYYLEQGWQIYGCVRVVGLSKLQLWRKTDKKVI
jgi:NAD(P)-dependent dehydrogenase (short-subunit alcohol dehydrogenase family)